MAYLVKVQRIPPFHQPNPLVKISGKRHIGLNNQVRPTIKRLRFTENIWLYNECGFATCIYLQNKGKHWSKIKISLDSLLIRNLWSKDAVNHMLICEDGKMVFMVVSNK